jgi:phosphatidate cytidylyltransferase
MGGLAVASLAVEKAVFVGLVILALLVAVRELGSALATAGIRIPEIPLAVGAVAMPWAAYDGVTDALMVALALTVVGVVVWRLTEGPDGYVRDTTAGVFTALYVPFLAGFAALLDRPDDGAGRVATFVILTVCNDVGGYTTGSKLGKHPMAPKISPKKSWEGFAGSVLTCMLAGAICMETLVDGHWWQGLILGVAAAFASTVGDLGESVLKRDIGVKDMGNLLPGHGGLMDRLDSLLVNAPVIWLLLAGFVDPATAG